MIRAHKLKHAVVFFFKTIDINKFYWISHKFSDD